MNVRGRIAGAFIGGSLWLVVAGSAFYMGGACASQAAYLFAAGTASFSASLFLAYPAALTGRFGYSTLSYLWFLLPFYAFFVSPADGLPYGAVLVVVLDYALAKGKLRGLNSRHLVLPLVAGLYGLIYFPILPAGLTLALNAGLVASAVGVGVEFSVERTFVTKYGPLRTN